MKAEKDAFELYSKLAKIETEENYRPVFKKLAQMELIHKNKLESLYDDMFYPEN
jgi:rubrerythrin